MRVFTHGKVPVNDFTSKVCPSQNLHQNQTSERVGFFGVSGILEGYLADSRYQLSQGGGSFIAPAIVKNANLAKAFSIFFCWVWQRGS